MQDGPSPRPRRDHRPGRRHRPQRTSTSTTTTRTPRRSSLAGGHRGPAVRPADRRHLLHQPLVRHGRGRCPRRSCRSATSAWSSATTAGSARTSRATAFRHGERVAEGERGVLERPLGPGKYAVQHLRRQHHPGADDELRPPLGHRPDRDPPLRREPPLDRPRHQGRLRADAAALGRRPHRLPEGPERDPAVRRRQEADHADARPDALGLLPRRRPQADDAAAPAGPRRHPARGRARRSPRGSASSTSSASTS